jgi:hypothetical protein
VIIYVVETMHAGHGPSCCQEAEDNLQRQERQGDEYAAISNKSSHELRGRSGTGFRRRRFRRYFGRFTSTSNWDNLPAVGPFSSFREGGDVR